MVALFYVYACKCAGVGVGELGGSFAGGCPSLALSIREGWEIGRY